MNVDIGQILPLLQRTKEYAWYYSALCPFHDDSNPSLLVSKEGGWFRCLGCGRTGDYRMLYRQLTGWSAPSYAVEAEKADFKLPVIPRHEEFAYKAHKILDKFSDSLGWYLRLRGIEDQILPQELGWHNGWYTFPVYSLDGTYNGVILRAGSHIEKGTGLRYVIKSHGTSLYFPDSYLAMKSEYLVITFGIIDAVTLTKMRIPACSTIHGKTFRVNELDWARKPVVLFPDKGEENSAMKFLPELGWRGRITKIAWPDGMKDANDLYTNNKEMLIRNTIESATK